MLTIVTKAKTRQTTSLYNNAVSRDGKIDQTFVNGSGTLQGFSSSCWIYVLVFISDNLTKYTQAKKSITYTLGEMVNNIIDTLSSNDISENRFALKHNFVAKLVMHINYLEMNGTNVYISIPKSALY